MKVALNKVGILLMGLLLCVLTGCASTYSSHVVTVNQLPQNLTQKSYQIVASQEQSSSPEFQHASDEVRARLKELGFTETQEQAALQVKLDLRSSYGDVEVWSAHGTVHFIPTAFGTLIPVGAFMNPRFLPVYSRFPVRRPFAYWYDPFYSPFYVGRFGSPFYQPYTVRQYYKHEVAIDISETKGTKPLYQVTARSERSSPEMDEQIPFLVESALREFPMKTGKTWVQLKIEK